MSEESGSELGQAIINDDGSFSETWMESLPEELREDATLKSIPDFPSMAKMLVSGQKMIGADKIIVPGKESTDEDWGKIFDKLGRPEKSEGYALAKPELPEGMPWDDASVLAFQEVAHKTGLLPKQTKDLYDWYNGITKDIYTENQRVTQEAYDGAVAALKKEWGAAYDQKLELARTAVKAFAGEDDVKALDEGMGNDPRMIKLFATIGAAISEDRLKGVNQINTPTEVQGEINKILGDPKHPYHDKKHPDHAAAVSAMQNLYKQIYPEEEK
jgi:hypothetical protein